MPLDGRLLEEIQSALVEAFSAGEFAQLVRGALDVRLETVTHSKGLRDEVYDLIVWAERNNRVLDLLQEAAKLRPGNQAFGPIIAALTSDGNNQAAALGSDAGGALSAGEQAEKVGPPVVDRPQLGKAHYVWLGLGLTGCAVLALGFYFLWPRLFARPQTPIIGPAPLAAVADSIVRYVAFTEPYLWLTVKKNLGWGPTVGLLQWDPKSGATCLYQHLSEESGCGSTSAIGDPIGPEPDSIAAIWAGNEDIYVGVNGSGVMHGTVLRPGLTTFTKLFPLPDVQVLSLHKDQRGYLWVGTTEGVYRVKDGDTVHYQGIDQICQPSVTHSGFLQVYDIAEDAEGIWLATNAGVLYLADNGVDNFCHQSNAAPQCSEGGPLIENDVWSVEIDSSNTVWVGSLNGYVSSLQRTGSGQSPAPGCWRVQKLPVESAVFSSNRVHALQEAGDGALWAATFEGLFFRAAAEQEWKHYPLQEALNTYDIACLSDQCAYGTSQGLYMTGLSDGPH